MSAVIRQPAYDNDRELIWFPVKSNGKQIRCAISYAALMTRYGARGTPNKSEALSAFSKHREAIESLANSLIQEGRVNKKNELFIKPGDTLADLAGIWKDDPTVDEMVKKIYEARGTDVSEEGE